MRLDTEYTQWPEVSQAPSEVTPERVKTKEDQRRILVSSKSTGQGRLFDPSLSPLRRKSLVQTSMFPRWKKIEEDFWYPRKALEEAERLTPISFPGVPKR